MIFHECVLEADRQFLLWLLWAMTFHNYSRPLCVFEANNLNLRFSEKVSVS